MTDKVRPSLQAPGKRHEIATTIAKAGGSGGWIVPASEVELADEDPDLDDAALNAFAETSSANSLQVTIDAGEAFVGGAWLARDVATTVELAASTASQTVYLGWDKSNRDTVIIGRDTAFSVDDRRLPLWTFDTDGSGVTAASDYRHLGQPSDAATYATMDDVPSQEARRPGGFYFVESEGQLYIETGN